MLDTYEEERSQHVHTLTSRIKAIGHHICERDPEAARLRDESVLAQGGGQAPTVTRQKIVPPLETGLLSETRHPANGTLFLQPWILTPDGEVRMDTITGHGWRLILDGRVFTAQDAIGAAETYPFAVLPIVIGGKDLRERDGLVALWFDRQGCSAALIRPDHYVYGVAENLNQMQTLVQALCNRFLTPLFTRLRAAG